MTKLAKIGRFLEGPGELGVPSEKEGIATFLVGKEVIIKRRNGQFCCHVYFCLEQPISKVSHERVWFLKYPPLPDQSFHSHFCNFSLKLNLSQAVQLEKGEGGAE